MKIKHALLAIALGWIALYTGALIKHSNENLASYLLNVAVVLIVGGGLAFIYKLSTHPKVKEFLNH